MIKDSFFMSNKKWYIAIKRYICKFILKKCARRNMQNHIKEVMLKWITYPAPGLETQCYKDVNSLQVNL